MYEFKDKDLEQMIKEAESNGSYLITVTEFIEPTDLKHTWVSNHFPVGGVMPTLESITKHIYDNYFGEDMKVQKKLMNPLIYLLMRLHFNMVFPLVRFN